MDSWNNGRSGNVVLMDSIWSPWKCVGECKVLLKFRSDIMNWEYFMEVPTNLLHSKNISREHEVI
jgi:hypothetical protein